MHSSIALPILICLAAGLPGCAPSQQSLVVVPTVQTAPVDHPGDSADDPALWIHPNDPSRSLVVASDKKGGIYAFSLEGDVVQRFDAGPVNNIDVRQGVVVGARTYDILAASRTDADVIDLFSIDPRTGRIAQRLDPGASPALDGVYGLCMYREAEDGRTFVFVNNRDGVVRQFAIVPGSSGVSLEFAREIHVGGGVEGMVADDELGLLYVGEEEAGIWRYDASPTGDTKRELVCAVKPVGELTRDIEGLALYKAGSGAGYLIASSQGSDEYFAFDRRPPNAPLGRFRIDGVTHTDGIEASSADLGGAFPKGVFVAQDDDNKPQNQNFKLVPFERIESALGQARNTTGEGR